MSNRNIVNLSSDERSFLDNLIRSGSSKARVLTRARILLMTDYSQGKHKTDVVIAQSLMSSVNTVVRTRERFVAEGIDSALSERPRPGQKPKITGDIEAQLVTLACSDPPDGRDKWTAQLLADRLVELGHIESISRVAVYQRLKKRYQALASKVLVHRQALGQVRRQNGRRSRRIPASI